MRPGASSCLWEVHAIPDFLGFFVLGADLVPVFELPVGHP